MTQSRHRACGYLLAVAGATQLLPPRSDDSAAAGPPLLIRWAPLPLMPTYLAANLHIWRPFPYPPPGEAVGSLQLGPNKTHTHTHTHTGNSGAQNGTSMDCVKRGTRSPMARRWGDNNAAWSLWAYVLYVLGIVLSWEISGTFRRNLPVKCWENNSNFPQEKNQEIFFRKFSGRNFCGKINVLKLEHISGKRVIRNVRVTTDLLPLTVHLLTHSFDRSFPAQCAF